MQSNQYRPILVVKILTLHKTTFSEVKLQLIQYEAVIKL